MSRSRSLVIDAHQHVWDPARAAYPWFRDEHAPIARRIGIEDVLPSFARAGVIGSVLVQSADNADDTAGMLEVAAAHPEVLGVVAWAPLDRAEEAQRMLDARPPIVVGVRNLIHDLPDPDWLLRPEVDEGLGVLERAGLPFDLVAVLPRHLELVPILVERHPELTIVIDHLGHPPIGRAPHPWWGLLTSAAQSPRVVAKVSGLYPPTPLDPADATRAIRPFVEHALEVFGPRRLMYGGDWPMSLLSTGYDATWLGLAALFDELDGADREQVLAGTATRVYGLDPARVTAAAERAESQRAQSTERENGER